MLEENPVRTVWHLLVLLTFGERELWVVHLGNETDSRAGQFLGYVKKYWFFGEIFTSDLKENSRNIAKN